MKRSLFYFILLVQIIAILLLVIQYNLIDKYGKDMTLLTQKEIIDTGKNPEDYFEHSPNYLALEISNIPNDKWDAPKNFDYNDHVNVLLAKNESGIYEVVYATDKEIKNNNNGIVLPATNIYRNETNGFEVTYGIEELNTVKHKEILKDYTGKEQYEVTFKVAPWGQIKLINIK